MIKKNIKKIMNSNKYTKKIFVVAKDLKNSTLIKETGKNKKYPKSLQMPITSKCNSRCVMCNIPNMDKKNEMTAKDFGKALQDEIFKEIESIGINGGEPFLLNYIEEYVKNAIENLPKLKAINIISNGFLTERILEKCEIIHLMCAKANKNFDIIISLDGYGEIHDKVRGIPGAFKKVENTIRELYKETYRYADRIELACTVVKHNVNHLIELDTYCKLNKYNIKYRLGIENERIDNKLLMNDFSVLLDKDARQTAIEFFHYKFNETKDFKYYSIFKYLAFDEKRLMGCAWKENAITMDPKGNLYYCAVESKKIGNIFESEGEKIFFNNQNIDYRQRIVSDKCNKCIHDYTGDILTRDIMKYYCDRLKQRNELSKYKKGL